MSNEEVWLPDSEEICIPCIKILPYAIFKNCNILFLMDAHGQSV